MRKRSFRVFALLLVLAAILTLVAGCGSTSTQSSTKEQTAKQQVKVGALFTIPDPAHGGGWDLVQYAGLQVLQKEFGWKVSIADNVPYSQANEVAAAYADKGYNMVIYTDNGYINSWQQMSQKYPNTWFVMMSVANTLPAEGTKVAAWSPDMYAYGAMVGAVAALASKSGVIGLEGGVPIPAVDEVFSGAIQGAKAVRPNTKIVISWAGDWVDVAKNSEATSSLLQKGADELFTITGPGYKGVYEAAQTKGAHVIGYASDWYQEAPNSTLTSILIDGPKMYREMAQTYESGKMSKKITTVGVDYFKLAPFRGSVSSQLEKKIKDTFSEIQSGKMKIPVKIYNQLNPKY